MLPPTVVVIGAGQAGHQLAASLRSEGFEGRIILIGDEHYPPYQRPPLSKAYLQAKASADQLLLRQMNWYREERIDLRTGIRAARIDRDARRVVLDDGTSLVYDQLVLATGARARRLTIEGAELPGVLVLRSLDDADRIRTMLGQARSVAVIGGGFIGLEFAAVARRLGKAVTVVEAQSRLLARVVAPPISDFFAQLHESEGVSLVLGGGAARLTGSMGRVSGVDLDDGRRLEADLVLAGIGVEANDDIAATAGLACDQGIMVDAHLRTSDPAIFAIGDCVTHHNPFADRRMRVESVQNAVDQARCAAANIMGRAQSYRAVPWFWSDQYDVKLQMVGFSAGANRTVLRGSHEERRFSIFHFAGDRLLGIDSVNRAADHMLGRRLLAEGRTLPPEAAGDESVDLKRFLT